MARQVGAALAERLKQPVVIENIAGGGGNIGADRAAKSPADGYTLYLGNNATVGLNTLVTKKLSFDPIKDLAPVSIVAESQTVLVRTLPENGRKALYLASHAVNILGFSKEKSNKLLNELMEFATQRQFVYVHRWRVHDLVMWDNRCTMHRGTEYDERRWKRDMHRATVSDIGNTLEV